MNELHYGVVVGINRYPEISHLRNAKRDAEEFYHWLIDLEQGAVPKENVLLITVPDAQVPDGLPKNQVRPVKDEIEDALSEIHDKCIEKVEEDPDNWELTRLYFFCSGHGIAPTPGDAALLLANAGPRNLGRHFSCSKYLEFYQDAQYFRELVFFADCCRDREADVPLIGPSWTGDSQQNGQTLAIQGYAATFGERAFEENRTIVAPDDRRGYFTKALLEGLQGQAANPDTHEIDSDSLSKYIDERVKSLTGHINGGPQVPNFLANPINPKIIFRRDVPTDRIEEAIRQKVRIFFPDGFNGDVILLNGKMEVIGQHSVGAEPWSIPFPLENGIYKVIVVNGTENVAFKDNGFFTVIGENTDVNL